jgi:hypothetical protein
MSRQGKNVVKALKISDIVVEDIILETSNKKKTTKVPITYHDGGSIAFQTPFLEISADKLRKTSFPHIYQIDTLFKGDSKSKINQFYQFIESLESHIINQVAKNGSKWFDQKKIILKSLIRESDLNKGMYYIKWPIELKEKMFIDENNNVFNPKNFKEKDSIRFIVELSNLWIDANQFGLACIVQKIMVRPFQEKILSEYEFAHSDSTNSEDEEHADNIISLLATEMVNSSKSKNNNKSHSNQKKSEKNPNQANMEIELVKHNKKNGNIISDMMRDLSSSVSDDNDQDEWSLCRTLNRGPSTNA